MSSDRYFVATVPISGGVPQITQGMTEIPGSNGEAWESDHVVLQKQGPQHWYIGSKNQDYQVAAYYLGRLPEGALGTTGQPAVIVCHSDAATVNKLKTLLQGVPNYIYQSLETAWQNATARDWMKNNGMPFIAGEFGPDPGSTYGRPRMPHGFQGIGSGDVFGDPSDPGPV